MKSNLILLTDSYKVTQYNQYPPDTTGIYSYFESRGGMFDEVTFFGLQYFVMEYLRQRVTMSDISEARALCKEHFGQDLMNHEGWVHIVADHGGRLPLRIKAVPEGTTVPVHNVLMTVENTCPKCYWLTNYMETLLVQTWYPTTVCTLSRNIKKSLTKWMLKTAGHTAGLEFKLHDFGFRGVSSVESAGLGGLAHLVNFRGTDTMEALRFGRDYYMTSCAGFSIPASEHSTMTSWGQDHEADAYANMLKQFPEGLVAVVSDSYDIYNACRNIWGDQLKRALMDRNGAVVIRPDSGNPTEVLCKVFEILGDQFGYSMNQRGYKLLPPYLKVIQGDGVDYGMINYICEALEFKGWSIEPLAFGMGGALLQKLHRDTQRFAFKCAARRNAAGEWLPVQKRPATDPTKNSKAGRMKLIDFKGKKIDGGLMTVAEDFPGQDLLEPVITDGYIEQVECLDYIRQRAAL